MLPPSQALEFYADHTGVKFPFKSYKQVWMRRERFVVESNAPNPHESHIAQAVVLLEATVQFRMPTIISVQVAL